MQKRRSASPVPRTEGGAELFLGGGALGEVAQEVDRVPDVLVADLAAPGFHEIRRVGRRRALDPLFDGPEDLDVGAAMIPLFIDEVCRFGAGRRGHAVTFSLKTVA